MPPRLVFSLPPPPPPTDHGDPDEIIERPNLPPDPPGSQGVYDEDEFIELMGTGWRESGWSFLSAIQAFFFLVE